MKRDVRLSEKFLILGYAYILLFMIVQDLVPLGTLNDVGAIAAMQSFSETLMVTMIGAVQILLLMGGILFFYGKKIPCFNQNLVDCASIMYLVGGNYGMVGSVFIWNWCGSKGRTLQCHVWPYPCVLAGHERHSAEYAPHHFSCCITGLHHFNRLYFCKQKKYWRN